MVDFVNAAVEDLKAKIKKAPLIIAASKTDGSIIYVYDQDQLVSQSEQLTPPYVGVIYEGLFSDGNAGEGSKGGLKARLRCAIFIVTGGETFGGVDQKPKMTSLLDEIRNEIRLTKAPWGHDWNFVEEILAPYDQDSFGYMQRWQTKAPLTQGLQ